MVFIRRGYAMLRYEAYFRHPRPLDGVYSPLFHKVVYIPEILHVTLTQELTLVFHIRNIHAYF